MHTQEMESEEAQFGISIAVSGIKPSVFRESTSPHRHRKRARRKRHSSQDARDGPPASVVPHVKGSTYAPREGTRNLEPPSENRSRYSGRAFNPCPKGLPQGSSITERRMT